MGRKGGKDGWREGCEEMGMGMGGRGNEDEDIT